MKCGQPDCNGIIEDGFCNVCGVAEESVETTTAANTQASIMEGAANTGVINDQSTARTVSQRLGTYRASATSIATYARTTRLNNGRGQDAGGTSESLAIGGSQGTKSSRRTSSRHVSTRRQMGIGLVDIPELAPLDPSTIVLTDPRVPEQRRFCAKCEEPVGRKTPKCTKCKTELHGEDYCPSCNKQNGTEKGFCTKCGQPFNFLPKLKAGDTVADQYEILGALAYGGLGWIYIGKDRSLSRWVVLKGLLNTQDPDALAAAMAERQFLAAVKHPSIVGVYNFVQHEGDGYIVMEYVGGKTLKTIRKERGPLPVTEAIAYIHRILGAFGYLHKQGLVYCDFKPDNFMQEGEDVKLIDMGAVRKIDDPKGAIYGTTGYSAPEAGQGPTIVSDLYTVARTLAVLIANIPGYDDPKRFLYQLPTPEQLPLFAEYESLYRWLLKATRKDPDERFQDAEEMAEQLAGVLREIVATQTGKPQCAESTVFNGENLGTDLTKPSPELIPSLKINPLDPAAQMIISAFNSGDVLAAMQATVKAFPKSMEARLQMAKLLIMQKGKGKETPEKNLASIEEEDPFEWRVAWTRGHAAFYNNKPEEAAPIFNLVLNELPGELAPRLALALAAEAANQPKDAIRFYEAVIKTDDRYSSAAFGLARCYLQNQQIDEAIKAFDRVPQTAALYKEAQIQKALTYCAKRTEEAFLKASEIITNLQLEAVELNEITINILSRAMEELEKGKRNSKAMRPSNKKVLGAALQVTAIKTGLEKAYRQLAVFAQTPAEKIGYADLANAIRPVTLL